MKGMKEMSYSWGKIKMERESMKTRRRESKICYRNYEQMKQMERRRKRKWVDKWNDNYVKYEKI